jgi:hypothetical protein
MDWVEWYAIMWIGLYLILVGYDSAINGRKREKTDHWYDTIISFLLFSPFIFRVLGLI